MIITRKQLKCSTKVLIVISVVKIVLTTSKRFSSSSLLDVVATKLNQIVLKSSATFLFSIRM